MQGGERNWNGSVALQWKRNKHTNNAKLKEPKETFESIDTCEFDRECNHENVEQPSQEHDMRMGVQYERIDNAVNRRDELEAKKQSDTRVNEQKY